jgi:hypothetical protein
MRVTRKEPGKGAKEAKGASWRRTKMADNPDRGTLRVRDPTAQLSAARAMPPRAFVRQIDQAVTSGGAARVTLGRGAQRFLSVMGGFAQASGTVGGWPSRGRVAMSSMPFRIPAARRRTARQPGRCRCRTAKNSAGGEPAPRLPFGTTHDLLLSLVLAGLRPCHQVRSACSRGLSMD